MNREDPLIIGRINLLCPYQFDPMVGARVASAIKTFKPKEAEMTMGLDLKNAAHGGSSVACRNALMDTRRKMEEQVAEALLEFHEQTGLRVTELDLQVELDCEQAPLKYIVRASAEL